jgi:hypothetical protein
VAVIDRVRAHADNEVRAIEERDREDR